MEQSIHMNGETMYPPVHTKPKYEYSFDRLNMLWDRYPNHHERTTFATLDEILNEHESYRKDFDDVKEEYLENGYDAFLIQLSWDDLAYRYATMEMQRDTPVRQNPFVDAFTEQFSGLDTDHKAYFIFPESYVSQFFVITEVFKKADCFHPIKSLFPDEEKVHNLAVFDKENMDDVLLMYHLLYSSSSHEVFGGYSLYDYPFPWYQNHLWQNGIVLRSPYLPDRIAKFQGNIPYYHNPAKTVYVRRNISHILECGYFSSELELFTALTRDIMPFLQWLYEDIAMYEEKDGFKTNWRMERTKIRTELTAEGIIKPKWKHEPSLFHAIRKLYPDTLYQYRPEWLGRQSLDMYIPSLETGIEYQGIQHYRPVAFFGGEDALLQRKELDQQKRLQCEENGIRLIEWAYDIEPTVKNIKNVLSEQFLIL